MYHHITSLGMSCSPFLNMERLGIKFTPSIFQQIATLDFQGMMRYLEAGCRGLYHTDRLKVEWSEERKHWWITDERYGISTYHYFNVSNGRIGNLASVQNTVRELEDSFHKLLAEGVSCVGVRTKTSREEAQALHAWLSSHGTCQFDLCLIDRGDVKAVTKEDWGNGAYAYWFPQRVDRCEPWEGASAYWDVVFSDLTARMVER